MTNRNQIRLTFPYPIAKLYEAVRIENEPHQRVRKLIDLYERTAQYLALAGLALYRLHGLQDGQVEALRPGLALPSLGHWVDLLKALSGTLRKEKDVILLTAQPTRVYQEDAIAQAMQTLAGLVEASVPKKPMLHHFLDTLVQFRNKKIGHGVLSSAEAKQAVGPLEAGLVQWLAEIAPFCDYRLLHIGHVEWSGGHFVCTGTNMDVGTTLDGARLERDTPVEPHRVFWHHLESGELISLHPLFFYDADLHLLYLYSELNPQGRLLLRCPYDAPGAQSTHVLDLDSTVVLGAALQTPGASTGQTTLPSAPATTPPPAKEKGAAAMRNWFDIIQPHEDIRKGHFDEAIFAADLGDVVSGDAPADYLDPGLFFRKTYLTGGLQHLLVRVHDKLATGLGQSVIEIQTPFGGGKTHSLVTVYHYLKHGERVRELLPHSLPPSPCDGEGGICAIVGTHHNPVEGQTSNGVTRRTLWGELAFQLGGKAGYQTFAENDRQRVSPGKAGLRAFLAARQPFILLFDEILEYVNRAAGVAYEDTTLASQSFAFFQELTETVAALPRGMMIVTLPSSYLEDYGERKEESLARLNKIFGRVESIETPVQGEEVYAVIRRRLFDVESVRRAEMNEVIYRYVQAYGQHSGDLPPKVRSADFTHKMELAYPFHPDVIDILYEKWSTFSSFQRTRGVLRLLASVVEDLYARESNIDLILPGDLNLDRPSIRQEFLKHIGPEYEGVIGSDIAGHEAKAQAMDRENRAWKHLAERVATALFFHSFSADDSEKGIGLPYVKLATLRSDTMPSMVTEVLGRLSNALWYLNSRADAHYFSRIPNLNRMILDKKELFNESYEERLKEIVRAELGGRFTAYLWPQDGGGGDVSAVIPDNRTLKLVILRPEDSGADIPAWIERKGETFRVYKNTLVFALADTGAFVKLREDVKTLMALEEIKAEIDAGQSGALATRLGEVQRRMHALTRDFSFNVRRMYHTLQVGSQRIDLGQPTAGNQALSAWYWRELEDREQIATRLHYRMLVNKFLAGSEAVSTQAVLDQFYKEPDLPALPSEEILARAVQLGVQEGAFGLAALADGEVDPDSLRLGQEVPLGAISFDEAFVLVERRRAEAILAELEVQRKVPPETTVPGGPQIATTTTTVEPGVQTGTTGTTDEGTERPPAVTHYKRVRLVVEGIPAGRIADVNRGILLPISRAVGDFAFTIAIDVSDAEGIARTTLENTIKETIRQIGGRIVSEELD
ncbi:MAG: ATP-binding protein [Anaerolineae bacterium]|nr:ATP-binding protein [Anaerolineae bacterium]